VLYDEPRDLSHDELEPFLDPRRSIFREQRGSHDLGMRRSEQLALIPEVPIGCRAGDPRGLVHDEGKPRTVGKGGLVLNPRGVPHAFVVTSEHARILSIMTPGSVGAFYRNASVPGESGPVDFAKVAEAAKETGATVILGPPPFAES
jgi:hypothetical protein